MADLIGDPTKPFKDRVRGLETTDPAHPDTFNPNYQTLIDNDVILKQFADDHENRITANEGTLADHESRITANESTLADHENRIGALEGQNLGNRVSNLEAVVSNPTGANNPDYLVLPVGVDKWAP